MPKYLIVLLFVLLTSLCASSQITVSANTNKIGKYDVYELTITNLSNYSNNWEDVKVNVSFSGPISIHINGFYYNTNTWKVRFAPPDTGNWEYILTFTTPSTTYSDTGSFTCIPSQTKGFLKKSPLDPFRLVYADGSLFNAIGFEDCILDFNGDGTPLDDFGFDGGFYPPNTLGSRTTISRYMNAYGQYGANFNLFRWTTNNCSFGLYNTISPSGNTYLVNEGMFGDSVVRSLRENGIRIWLTFFGPPVFPDINGSQPDEDAAIERYINYVVARYGAYVDIWELFNESTASGYYYNTISNYLRSIDPYHRLISVSDQQPQLSCIDINSPHWYQKESPLESDVLAYNMVSSRKSYNKPVIFGEQGNSVQNWDTLSSVRMRLRAWASFFAEGTLIFWNTSFSKNFTAPVAANIYLGPTERGYINAMQKFTALADSATYPATFSPSNSNEVRAYGLAAKRRLLGYFCHYNTHDSYTSTNFNIRLMRNATVYWINPADGALIDSAKLNYGSQTISTPRFMIDLAMRIDLSDHEPVFDETQKLDLIVYPNPASNQFSFDANINGVASVELYSLAGKKVYSQADVQNDQVMDIQRLIGGIYIYRIKSGIRVAAGKLLVKK